MQLDGGAHRRNLRQAHSARLLRWRVDGNLAEQKRQLLGHLTGQILPLAHRYHHFLITSRKKTLLSSLKAGFATSRDILA